MLQFEPVRLDFKEAFVTRELFRRIAGWFQCQTLFGVILDFLEQILHGRTNWEQNALNASAAKRNLVARAASIRLL